MEYNLEEGKWPWGQRLMMSFSRPCQPSMWLTIFIPFVHFYFIFSYIQRPIDKIWLIFSLPNFFHTGPSFKIKIFSLRWLLYWVLHWSALHTLLHWVFVLQCLGCFYGASDPNILDPLPCGDLTSPYAPLCGLRVDFIRSNWFEFCICCCICTCVQ